MPACNLREGALRSSARQIPPYDTRKFEVDSGHFLFIASDIASSGLQKNYSFFLQFLLKI